MTPWNLNYFIEQDKTEVCEFDINEFNQYFELHHFIAKFMEFLEDMYGVKIALDDTEKGWHPSVKVARITGHEGKDFGTVYIDLVQRDDKRPGAWFNRLGPKTYTVVTNYPPEPKDKTARHLLSFDDVNTTFHEFGHCFHAVMSDAGLEALEGADVFWDFVEVPSQFFENFTYERDVLKRIGENEKGEQIPDALIQKLQKRKTYLNSPFVIKQLSYGIIDTALHGSLDWQRYESTPDGFTRLDNYLYDQVKNYEYDWGFKVKTIFRHFTHILTSVYGYTCGYYCYLWADVIQYHLFEHYQQAHDFQRYVDCILKPGNAKDPNELVKDYCGGYGFGAFLRAQGLAPEDDARAAQ